MAPSFVNSRVATIAAYTSCVIATPSLSRRANNSKISSLTALFSILRRISSGNFIGSFYQNTLCLVCPRLTRGLTRPGYALPDVFGCANSLGGALRRSAPTNWLNAPSARVTSHEPRRVGLHRRISDLRTHAEVLRRIPLERRRREMERRCAPKRARAQPHLLRIRRELQLALFQRGASLAQDPAPRRSLQD